MPHTTSGFRPSRKRSIPTTSSTSRHPSGNLNPLRPSTVTLLWHLFGLYSYIIMNHRFFSLGHSILARCILLLITDSSISGVDSCSCGFISHTTIESFFNVNFNQFGHSHAFIRLRQRDLVTAGVKTVDTVLRFFCSGTLFTFGAGQTGANDYMGLLALERNVGAEHLVLSVPPVALFDDWTPCIGADISNMTASDDDHLHFYCAQAHRVVFTCLSRSKGKQSH